MPPRELMRPRWSAEPLTHNASNGVTGGIWRVRRDDDSAILKIATPPGMKAGPAHLAASADPGHWNYWRREALAYQSGLTARAFAGIAAPRLLSTQELRDGSLALWLEDVAGLPGPVAGPAALADLAHRLGAGQARWVKAAPPTDEWLARDFLRGYTGASSPAEPPDWEQPTAVAAWSPRLRADLRLLWERRAELLDAVGRLPRTLCHHDLWPMNVIIGPVGPVLLDWAFVGPGPIGEDVANLILDTFFDGLVPVDLLDEVTAAVGDAYRQGSGLPESTVRHAIMLTGAAKYYWLAPRMIANVRASAGPGHYDRRDDVERFAGRAPILARVTRWAATAMRSRGDLGI